jgi:hypothetical protein
VQEPVVVVGEGVTVTTVVRVVPSVVMVEVDSTGLVALLLIVE